MNKEPRKEPEKALAQRPIREALRSFCRGEKSYYALAEMLRGAIFSEEVIYPLKAEDLLCYLRCLDQNPISYSVFLTDWKDPIESYFWEALGLPSREREPSVYALALPLTEEDLMTYFFLHTDNPSPFAYEDSPLRENMDLDRLIRTLESFLENHHLPPLERAYPEEDQIDFIQKVGYFNHGGRMLDKKNPLLIPLYRSFVDQLSAKEKPEAQIEKALSLLTGTPAYPKDLPAAKACLDQAALYGDPEIEKGLAKYYLEDLPPEERDFSKAKVHLKKAVEAGSLWAKIQWADLLGEDTDEALSLYQEVYDLAMERLSRWEMTGSFPEAAVRLGKRALKDSTPEGGKEAYRYFLAAQRVLALRIEKDQEEETDPALSKEIESLLLRGEKALAPSEKKEAIDLFDAPELVAVFLEWGYEGILCLHAREEGGSLEILRRPKADEQAPQKALVTLPSMGYCQLLEGISFALLSPYAYESASGEEVLVFDDFLCQKNEKRCRFFYRKKEVFTCKARGILFQGKEARAEEKEGFFF